MPPKNASNLAVEDTGIPCSTVSSLCHTVDGRNPAPVDMVNIPLFIGFHTSQVVQEFSHQQIGKLGVSKCHWIGDSENGKIYGKVISIDWIYVYVHVHNACIYIHVYMYTHMYIYIGMYVCTYINVIAKTFWRIFFQLGVRTTTCSRYFLGVVYIICQGVIFPQDKKIIATDHLQGHYTTNPNNELFKGNPSKLPYICMVWFPPNG